jgi:exopolysaccharide biosynthesis polyprenyl glycosylphosphotransferase
VARKLRNHPEYGIELVGVIHTPNGGYDTDLPALAQPDQLSAVVRALNVERVIVACPHMPEDQALEAIRSLIGLDIQIDIVPYLHELIAPGMSVHTVEGLPLIGMAPMRLSNSSLFVKRGLDLAIAIAALLLLSPLFALIALAIRWDSPGPAFFRQLRVGQDDRSFRIIKFRTMVTDAEAHKHELTHLNSYEGNGGDPVLFKAPGDPRVTRVGRVLRRYFMDELPQLLNVVRGEMSLVGPRPLVTAEDEHVGAWARRMRLNLKPGMTGLWQVLGGPTISFDEMVKLDYLYVTSWSVGADLRLLAKTLPLAVRGGGGSH